MEIQMGLMDTDDAARYLGTTARHVRRLMTQHGLPVVRLGSKVRFRREDLDEFVESARSVATPA